MRRVAAELEPGDVLDCGNGLRLVVRGVVVEDGTGWRDGWRVARVTVAGGKHGTDLRTVTMLAMTTLVLAV